MEYDRELLEQWCKMEDWGTYLEKNGGVNKFSSKEGFDFLGRKYYQMVNERIEHCKELLKDHEDAFLCYVMAELYDRCNEDESPIYLYKRPVRYYALRALEFDPNFELAKKLLNKAREWVGFLGGDKDYMPELEIRFKKRWEEKEKST